MENLNRAHLLGEKSKPVLEAIAKDLPKGIILRVLKDEGTRVFVQFQEGANGAQRSNYMHDSVKEEDGKLFVEVSPNLAKKAKIEEK